ncbi:hypothetical protein CI105_01685 [Candidatus Izimaplasma bacterium ZiA1]|uniref:hypothetical protein n=1 Tax=Candidatus Izimoplasma sp. ZiA1 TaxID=2024899 RepID=UPI000BAA41C1|nr:hypothetical protein CI105_01685 [Candidatus Izimaplasma bacterium ZiA1]
MRRFNIGLVLLVIVLLSGCKKAETANNFKTRKDDYFVSEDKSVLIHYKTNEFGELVQIDIDRLLEIEEIIYFDTTIDFDMVVEGFAGDLFMQPRSTCVDYNNILVPINIEVGSTRYKFDRTDCEYQEVNRYNEVKTGSYISKFRIEDTIDVSKTTKISIVYYDPDSFEKFIEVKSLINSRKSMGVFGIELNETREFLVDGENNYYYDMNQFEQFLLSFQELEGAVNAILGVQDSVNIFDFDQLLEASEVIEDFEELYAQEINAVQELFNEVGVNVAVIEETSSDGE